MIYHSVHQCFYIRKKHIIQYLIVANIIQVLLTIIYILIRVSMSFSLWTNEPVPRPTTAHSVEWAKTTRVHSKSAIRMTVEIKRRRKSNYSYDIDFGSRYCFLWSVSLNPYSANLDNYTWLLLINHCFGDLIVRMDLIGCHFKF